MLLLGVDFESQCSEPTTTRVTEVGARLVFESGNAAGQPLNEFCYDKDGHLPQTDEIVELTGITDEMLQSQGKPTTDVFRHQLIPMVESADYVLAHNKRFDQVVFESTCTRLGLSFPQKHWICTWQDVPYPKRYRCKQLAHLGFDHGLKMDGRQLHRALNDVDLMLELVLKNYQIDQIIARSLEPWVYLKADILGPWVGKGGDGGAGKTAAGKLGYGWEKPRLGPEQVFPKTWVKAVKRSDVVLEKELAPFRVIEL